MVYEGYQLDKVSLSENVQRAIDMYIRKHGEPPNILESSLKDVPLPDGMSIVTRWVKLPTNILLIGKIYDYDKSNQSSLAQDNS